MATVSRLTVPFQYAWRFHYGDDPTSPPECGPGTCKFPINLQDQPICEVKKMKNSVLLSSGRVATYAINCA